jgi:uncharacterized protein YeaO (DUF488 family)
MARGTILTKRWCDKVNKKVERIRILICRYRPRALPKEKETWNIWCANLGPSKELHAAFYGKHGQEPIGLEEYTRRYLAEMKEQDQDIAYLAQKVAEGQTITLMCSSACEDESHCHRSLLKKLIEEKLAHDGSGEPVQRAGPPS